MARRAVTYFLLFLLFCPSFSFCDIADEIRYEATLPNNSGVGYPLPLAAHWNTGWNSAEAFTPDYQMGMIEKGHYLIPSFYLTNPYDTTGNKRYSYYEKAIKKAAALHLPFSFVSTQWERYLTDRPEYFGLAAEDNPNVVDSFKVVHSSVSPFGPVSLWQEVGGKWTSAELVEQLESWYPDPPAVFFVSNNEHDKLKGIDAENDYRYVELYGTGRDDDFKRRVVGDGWIERYGALINGMKNGFSSEVWKNKSKFIGYNTFGNRSFGRYVNWFKETLFSTGRISPWPSVWDGASVSYYTDDWSDITDFNVFSSQTEAMNWIFMLDDVLENYNKDFIFELSVWDGYEPEEKTDKRAYYASLGQTFDPYRYEGYVQFGMWVTRPRVVREFRGNSSTMAKDEPYFLSIVRSVDRVHNNQILKKFWRSGKLVANTKFQHPYQKDVPSEYASIQRWYLLDTNLDTVRPWTLYTPLPAFSLALVLGNAPKREWLVYTHAPVTAQRNLQITLPEFGTITVDSSRSGSFYLVKEADKTITPIDPPNTPTAPTGLEIK